MVPFLIKNMMQESFIHLCRLRCRDVIHLYRYKAINCSYVVFAANLILGFHFSLRFSYLSCPTLVVFNGELRPSLICLVTHKLPFYSAHECNLHVEFFCCFHSEHNRIYSGRHDKTFPAENDIPLHTLTVRKCCTIPTYVAKNKSSLEVLCKIAVIPCQWPRPSPAGPQNLLHPKLGRTIMQMSVLTI